ncbi:MAG: amidohydrolase family protein [Gemmatimonadaceae bacterium]|nr:amidohydrolase family protein [Gemmatimonadaceae bacterium]
MRASILSIVIIRRLLTAVCVAAAVAPAGRAAAQPATTYDLILRGGTVVDGTGAPRFRADVAITRGHIARVGDLSRATARTDIDVRGLFVAPGFINIHSHAVPSVLPTAENMLTQGVTTELLNADGAGPADIGAQLDGVAKAGLAVNVAASAGFNSVWASVMGPSDKRPTSGDITRMRTMILANLERGAFGISAGLDYKPAYFSTVPEVIDVLSPARPWRTFFPNHDRLAPEFGYSSRKGMEETMVIGEGTGLVPVFTHMKVQGHEQGTADAVLAMMRTATAAGRFVAADVYPYLSGQTALAALIIPGWAQDGGIAKMRERFADPALRARIIVEADQAITARFNGASSIVLNETGRKLSDIMQQQGAKTPGEAVVRVLETEFPSAILSFGAEADLRKILQYPDAVIACDCGAWTETRAHPRGFGTFPRILGHYVRETHVLTWEQAVRKMSALPAALTGMVDRGVISPGMAADIAVFDTATIIDHATYEAPNLKSDGIRVVLVNGVVALRDGAVTGARGGVALRRSGHMPSREMRLTATRRVRVSGALQSEGVSVATRVAINVTQRQGARAATGSLRFTTATGERVQSTVFGTLQPGPNWASVTGRVRVGPDERAFTLIVEGADPLAKGTPATVVIAIEGMTTLTGTVTGTTEITKR